MYINYTFSSLPSGLGGKSCFIDSCSKTEVLNLGKSADGLQVVGQLPEMCAKLTSIFLERTCTCSFLRGAFKLKGNYIITGKRKKDLEQGCQTHLHRGPHQLCGCLQRSDTILGLYKCSYSLTVKEWKLHSALWRQLRGWCGPWWKWVWHLWSISRTVHGVGKKDMNDRDEVI